MLKSILQIADSHSFVNFSAPDLQGTWALVEGATVITHSIVFDAQALLKNQKVTLLVVVLRRALVFCFLLNFSTF